MPFLLFQQPFFSWPWVDPFPVALSFLHSFWERTIWDKSLAWCRSCHPATSVEALTQAGQITRWPDPASIHYRTVEEGAVLPLHQFPYFILPWESTSFIYRILAAWQQTWITWKSRNLKVVWGNLMENVFLAVFYNAVVR